MLIRRPHLLHVFSTFVPAGPELRTVRLIEAFGDRFRHTIVAMDGRTTAASCLPRGVDVQFAQPRASAGSIRATTALCALTRRVAPDLVLTYNWGAFDMLLAARLLGIRRVVHHEDGFNADEATTLKRRRSLARRIVCRGVARVVVPSRNLERIAVNIWRLQPGSVRRIPNGIALSPPAGPAARVRERADIASSSRLIVTVAHLRQEKRLDRLIEAARLLPAELDAHVIIVGDGPDRERLVRLAAEASIAGRVHFLGHRDDVRSILDEADLFALSSDTEQMPVSLLEAMAAGLPAVSTNVGDIAEMLPPEHGRYLVSVTGASTAAALAARMCELLSTPSVGISIGRANRARVCDEFGFEKMRDAYLDEYERTLGARAS